MQDKEYLVETRIKNNKLYKLIMQDYPSIAKFCKAYNLVETEVGRLINFKQRIYNKKNGKLNKIILKLMEIFNCKLEDLIPINYAVKETNKFLTELNEEEMLSLADMSNNNLLALTDETSEDLQIKKEQKEKIHEVINNYLWPREKYIIEEAVMNERKISDVARDLNISVTRAGQIRDKALLKLKHPCKLGLINK